MVPTPHGHQAIPCVRGAESYRTALTAMSSFPILVGTGSSDGVAWELSVVGSGSPPALHFSLRTTDEVSGFAGASGTAFQTLANNASSSPMVAIGSTLIAGPPDGPRRLLVVEVAKTAHDLRLRFDDGGVARPEVLDPGNGLPNLAVAPLRSLPLTIECTVVADAGERRPERLRIPALPRPDLRTDGPTGGPPRPRVVERRIPPSDHHEGLPS